MRLYGKNPVIERLRSNPSSIRKIHFEQGSDDLAGLRKKASKHNIPVVFVPKLKMIKLTRGKNAQGVIAEVDDFEYMSYEDLLDAALSKKRCILFLDGLTDPQNLGALIRSAGCFGYFSLVLPTHKSVAITETVLRVASGGENFIHAAKVANIRKAIVKAKDAGFSIAGTVVSDGQSLVETTLPYPLAVVIGSEQKGIRDVHQKFLDLKITIPMQMDRMSFNVAHATTIICYEVTRQRLNYQHSKKSQSQA